VKSAPITRSNATSDEIVVEDDEDEDDDDLVDEEDEESSEDEKDERYTCSDFKEELSDYKLLMDKKLKEIRGNEMICKKLNSLSVEDVVNMIESSNDPCEESQKKKIKKNKNRNKKNKNQQKFEEVIESKLFGL
jgi:hypothetical protein